MNYCITINSEGAAGSMDWAIFHCPSYIDMTILPGLDEFGYTLSWTCNFYFAKEEDLTLFALRWA